MDFCQVEYEVFSKDHLTLMEPVLSELGISASHLNEFLKQPQNMAFIARQNHVIQGFLYGYKLDSLNSNPQFFVYSIDILDPFKGQGIGSKLFQYVVDYTRKHNYSECFVITDKANKPACRIYEKAGGKNDFVDEIVYVIQHDK